MTNAKDILPNGNYPTLRKDFNAKGDGTTSDQAAVANATASNANQAIYLDDGLNFLVTSLINTNGVKFEGSGRIVKAITGGNQQLNSYVDKHKYICGREYMYAFHQLLINQATTASRAVNVTFSGDSTTLGLFNGGSIDTPYKIDQIFKTLGYNSGLSPRYGFNCTNSGHSSQATDTWLSTYLSTDMSGNPDLYILRWGINDAISLGQAAFFSNLRTGLAKIRNSGAGNYNRPLSSLTIILMGPNSTSDTPNNRDERWYESLTEGLKAIAREYNCVFLDTYAYLKDSRPAANLWMDDAFGDGRAIHPADVMNTWIVSLINEAVFPEGLRTAIGYNNVRNVSGLEILKNSTDLPSTYPTGISIYRASASPDTSFGWPLDGMVITFNHSDMDVFQIVTTYITAQQSSIYFRHGYYGSSQPGNAISGWSPFVQVPGAGGSSAPNLTFNTQTTNYTLALSDSTNNATQVNGNSASALTFTVPLNSSVAFPVGCQIFLQQIGAGQLSIAATGGVTIHSPSTLNLRTQWSKAVLTKDATDTWSLNGDLQ